jgi:hypothetical protein
MRILPAISLAAVAFFALCADSCHDKTPTSDQMANRQQEQLSLQAVQSVGMPAIVNFQEKRFLKQILELRDTKLSTITYTQDFNAKLHKLCDSVGYGIPYSTQYTNPQRTVSLYDHAIATIPQADPNGLFSPAAAEGTWVLCLNPESKDVAPVYVEPRVIVSTFPLPGVVP